MLYGLSNRIYTFEYSFSGNFFAFRCGVGFGGFCDNGFGRSGTTTHQIDVADAPCETPCRYHSNFVCSMHKSIIKYENRELVFSLMNNIVTMN